MFTIPGWSVSADSLETQRTLSNYDAQENPVIERTGDHVKAHSKITKKRKRAKTRAKEVNMTSENFAKLWKEHIEHDVSVVDVDGSASATATTTTTKRQAERQRQNENPQRKVTVVGRPGKRSEELGSEESGRDDRRGKSTKYPGIPSHEILAAKTRSQSSIGQSSAVVSTMAKGELSLSTPASADIANDLCTSTLTPLQNSMREKLISSRFRHLNETLYTTPSTTSYELFKQNPSFFTEYHEGFQRQVGVWPENPADEFVRWIKERGAMGRNGTKLKSQKSQFRKNMRGKKPAEKANQKQDHQMEAVHLRDLDPLPRDIRTGLCTVADLGCGNAQIARDLSSVVEDPTYNGPVMVKSLNVQIHSFDLAAPYPLITVADIRALPLADSSVDIAIFCLALMGTNWIEFIEEAWRVLRWKGECWVSEVSSRFISPKIKRVDHSVGKRTKTTPRKRQVEERSGYDEEVEMGEAGLAKQESDAFHKAGNPSTDVSAFVAVLKARGFLLISKPELGNKMFVRMRFAKGVAPTRGKYVPPPNGRHGSMLGMTPSTVNRNSDLDSNILVEDEAKALKPCVYKAR